jgi:hypothetical protein
VTPGGPGRVSAGMVRLSLSLLLFVGAGFALTGDVDRPLALAGFGVAVALLATVALDLVRHARRGGDAP